MKEQEMIEMEKTMRKVYEKYGIVSLPLFAQELYNAGFQKLPEDSVVLSREEYESLKGCENTVKRLSKISPTEAETENKALKEEIAIVLAQKRNIWKSYNQLKEELKQASKETAEKIFNQIIWYAVKIIGQTSVSSYYQISFDRLKELAKQFGVEIKE